MAYANLSEPLRAAIVADIAITSLLPSFKGSWPVFTNTPVPEDAEYPMVVISPDLGVLNADGVNDFRPMVMRSVTAFAANDTPEHARVADTVANLLRDLFHLQRLSITVPGWSVTNIQAAGPQPAASDDQSVGRIVTLTVQLAQPRT